MRRLTMVLAGCMAMSMLAAGAFAQGEMAKPADATKPMPAKAAKMAKPAMPMMSMFLIESPHTPEECMAVMDEAAKTKDLGNWEWGCMDGNHTAYRMVKAKDEAAAMAMVPANVRDKAHVYKLTKMTPAMLEGAHKQHM